MNAPSVATEKSLYRVSLKGTPLMGFVDKAGKHYARRPVERHYRRPADDLDCGIPDGWHTADELRDSYGVRDIKKLVSDRKKPWRHRPRLRTDLTAAMFDGLVIKARDKSHARAIFSAIAGINDTTNSNWVVAPAERGEKAGTFYGVRKVRGLVGTAKIAPSAFDGLDEGDLDQFS